MLNLKNRNGEQEYAQEDNLADGESKQLKSSDYPYASPEGKPTEISESFECSETVCAGRNQELPSIKVTNNDDIIIEEMYVDDWVSITNLNIPTDDITEAFIGDLSGFDFGGEDNVENETIQRVDEPDNDVESIGWSSEVPLNNKENDSEEHATGSEESTEIPSGRRIVDIFQFFEAIQRLNAHSHSNTCNFSNMRFVKELKQGLNSTFTFVCDVCKYTGIIQSNPPSNLNQQLEINYASVLGAYAVGIGFYQTQEFLGTLDVPFMAVATFDKRQKLLQNDLRIHAQQLENEAMEKEKLVAVEKKEVDVNGTPLLSGFVDGSFPKRSYRTHYDSLSGTACIIGIFLQLLDMENGSSHSYCLKHSKTVKKNFGVRYHKLIADGDSKTYKIIDEAKIYRNPTLKIEKIECILHLYRCAMGLLLKVKNLTSSEAERLLIGKNFTFCSLWCSYFHINSSQLGIKTAVKHWIQSDKSKAEKIENIRKDILNAPHHVFGDHSKCSDYFCDKDKHKDDLSRIPDMKKSGLYNNIMQALARLLENARSLLYNLNTNFPEQFNSIIAKHLGGKRVNYCTGLSYAGRVDCAAISFNTGRLVGQMKKFLSGESTLNENSVIYKIESARLKRRENTTKRGYQRKVLSYQCVCLPDKHYGTNTCQRPDLSPEVFDILKNIHLGSLEELQKDRTTVERETKDEANSNYREQVQEDVLTADKIGRICRSPTDDQFPSFVESIRYTSETVGNTKEIKHGRIFQNTALQLLSEMLKLEIKSCGIFIDRKYGFLGGHPTGLVDDEGIVLIKCPHTTFKMDINDAIEKRKTTFWTMSRKRKASDQNEVRQLVGINKKHDWYFEVQALLHVTERKFCIFAVWSGHDESSKSIKYEYVYPDEMVWSNQMEKKIVDFYYNHLLPEVIDPRKRRGMPIRGLQLKEKTLPDNTEIDPGDDETDDNDMIEQKLTTEDQPVVPSKMIKEKISIHPKMTNEKASTHPEMKKPNRVAKAVRPKPNHK
ncbi:hypothetical protein HA402_011454 [Bradysia odoriphaga]|nr:hypothetical protein HA402_011454 [Bradysia odoriphaga]